MVFTVDRVLAVGGFRHSDTVTETGVEWLTHYPRDLASLMSGIDGGEQSNSRLVTAGRTGNQQLFVLRVGPTEQFVSRVRTCFRIGKMVNRLIGRVQVTATSGVDHRLIFPVRVQVQYESAVQGLRSSQEMSSGWIRAQEPPIALLLDTRRGNPLSALTNICYPGFVSRCVSTRRRRCGRLLGVLGCGRR